jgi:hypothetical protein
VHAKGFLHGDSTCLKFFRTHRSALNSAKLSGLAKFEAFHAISEGFLAVLHFRVYFWPILCLPIGLSMALGGRARVGRARGDLAGSSGRRSAAEERNGDESGQSFLRRQSLHFLCGL